MRIAREEIFGPVLGVLEWSSEADMLAEVNAVEYGLTCSIWTNDISTAHRTAMAVQAGFVWINEVGKHFLGAPFGGVKQSGIGREECFEEMLLFTPEKNIHIKLKPQGYQRQNDDQAHPLGRRRRVRPHARPRPTAPCRSTASRPVVMNLSPEEIFFRAFRAAEFDICELSLSSFCVKTAAGRLSLRRRAGLPVASVPAHRHLCAHRPHQGARRPQGQDESASPSISSPPTCGRGPCSRTSSA